MAYDKKLWVDRQTEYPTRRKLTATGEPDVYDVSREEGLIVETGDPFNAVTMNSLEGRVERGINDSVLPATAVYDDGAFVLTGLPVNLSDFFTVRFKAPADFTEGDVLEIGGTAFAVKLSNMEDPGDELFVEGALVSLEIDLAGAVAFFKMGGGFPAEWREHTTAEAAEDIVRNQPVVVQDGSFGYPIRLDSPASLPTGVCDASALSPNSDYMAVGCRASPFIHIYKRSGDTFTKLSNPSTLPPASVSACSFSPDGTYLASIANTNNGIMAYKRNGDTFTALPSLGTDGGGYGCAFSPNGAYLAVSLLGFPYLAIYKRSGDTFTKLTNPSTMPAGYTYRFSFSPDSNYLAVSSASSPYILIYKRSGDTFTKLANPGVLPYQSRACSFSPDGRYLAVASTSSPFIFIYERDGDVFTKLPNPSVLPPSEVRFGCDFTPDGRYFIASCAVHPFLVIYEHKDGVFARHSDPSVVPPSEPTDCSISPDGRYLALPLTTSPFIEIYKATGMNTVYGCKRLNQDSYAPPGLLGIALESKSEGEQCKVNLLPALNEGV